MSAPERDHAAKSETSGAETLGGKAGRLLDDPFGSIWIGLASTATAVGAVATGILSLSAIY
jgi:hypothetical protein